MNLAAYLLVGGLVVGGAIGSHFEKCPNDKTPPPNEVVAAMVAWPAYIVAVLGFDLKLPGAGKCKASVKGDAEHG